MDENKNEIMEMNEATEENTEVVEEQNSSNLGLGIAIGSVATIAAIALVKNGKKVITKIGSKLKKHQMTDDSELIDITDDVQVVDEEDDK